MPASSITRAKTLFDASERIVVVTGAGISTDSGIPDFRGPNGLWTKDPNAERLSTISYMLMNPGLLRKSAAFWRDSTLLNATPNDGHKALVELEAQGKLRAIVTQNVDGLHQKAGNTEVYEIHGNIRGSHCHDCDQKYGPTKSGEYCHCGGVIRLNVVYFGEYCAEPDWSKSMKAMEEADLVVAVGTSLKVPTAANLIWIARHTNNTPLITINQGRTSLHYEAAVHLQMGASRALAGLCG